MAYFTKQYAEKLFAKDPEKILMLLFGNTKSKQLCPFHADKKPSMKLYVSGNSAKFYCFGCRRSYSIPQVYAKLNYNDLNHELVKKAYTELLSLLGFGNVHVVLDDAETLESAFKSAIREFIDRALTHQLSVAAKNFLAKKYIDAMDVPYKYKLYQLRPDADVDSITEHLAQKYKLDVETLKGIFMPVKPDRLVYSITDEDGDVVAFASRTLIEGSAPKYLNSRSYMLYSKNTHAYGMNVAIPQPAVSNAKELYIVEGYNDAIAMWENGYMNCIALTGISMSKVLLDKLLKAGYRHFHLLLDGDKAGDDAAKSLVVNVFAENGVTSDIIMLPIGMDVDDFFRVKGIQAFHSLPVEHDISVLFKELSDDANKLIDKLVNFDLDVLEKRLKLVNMQKDARFALLYMIAKRKLSNLESKIRAKALDILSVVGDGDEDGQL